MLFAVPVASAAAPAPSGSSSHVVWAYGVVRTGSYTVTTPDHWEYELTSTIGYSVVLTQTNVSATVFELDLARTMGARIGILACTPSCAHPMSTWNYSGVELEDTNASANFTVAGSVTEGSASVPALALLNTSSTVHANQTESYSVTRSGLLAALGNETVYFSADVVANASVAFSTPLGLLPLNLSQPQTWNSTSSFNATGAAEWDFYFHVAGPKGGASYGPESGNVSNNRSGTVAVQGSYVGRSITFNGTSYPVVSLKIVGPFSAREGFILIPSAANLFSGASEPWGGDESTVSTVSTTNIDARFAADGHLGLAASALSFDSSAANPAGSPTPPAATGTVAPDLAQVQPANTTLQATPESEAAATGQARCLQTGASCPGLGGATPGGRNLGPIAGFAVLAVVVAALIGSVVVVQRRRAPVPLYPNASLYPPGSGSLGARAPPRSTSGPEQPSPPPAEDDPLSHLW